MTIAETLKAEIIWALYCVKNCYSNNSGSEFNNAFSKMFSDSNIAKNFQMRCCKLMYLVNNQGCH